MWLLLLILSTASYSSYEVEDIFVTSKSTKKSDDLMSLASSIDEDEIERTSGTTLNSKLINQSDLHITQSGSVASNTSVILRGLDTKYLLFMIDGVVVNDPSTIDNQFLSSTLSSLDIEKIEILKGNQGVLYGPDAVAGVVNIITKKNNKNQDLSLEAGFNQGVSVSLNSEKFSAFASILQNEFNVSENGSEDDFSEIQNFRLTYKNKGLVITTFYDESNQDYDDSPALGEVLDNLLNKLKSEKWINSLSYTKDKIGFHLKQLNSKRSSISSFSSYNEANRLNPQFHYSYSSNLLLGFEGIFDDFDNNSDKFSTNDLGVFSRYSNKFFLAGIRYSENQQFGGNLLGEIGLKSNLTNKISLNTRVANGVKNPSLFQLYSPDTGFGPSGNEDLTPEKSYSVETGFEYLGNIRLEFDVYYNRIDNQIDFITGVGYQNQDSFQSWGQDLKILYGLNDLFLNFSFSHVDFRSDSKPVTRRPRNKASITFDYMNLNAEFMWVDRVLDQVGTSDYEYLDAYSLVNLSYIISYQQHNLKFSIDNILNQYYQQIAGFNTPGTTFSALYNYKF